MREIHGKPVIAHTIGVFQGCDFVREIIIVAKSEQLEQYGNLCREYGFSKVRSVIAGGETRSQSVFNGVFAVSDKSKLIAIHDGARPCVTMKIIEETLRAAAIHHAAAPGVPVISTIKKANGKLISETVDRVELFEIQTPQVFRAEIIKAGLTNALNKSIPITDDCMAAEIIGVPVYIAEGSRRNIKITEPDDFLVAEAFLA